MALKTALQLRRIAERLAVVELRVKPAAGRGVLGGVLDHELNAVLRVPRDERLFATEGLVVLFRRVVAPGQTRDHRAVGKGNRAPAIGGDRRVVAQNGADVVEGAF